MNPRQGIVYLVGGGPGDPGLITVRGLAVLRLADVVVHDRLSPRELLSEVRAGAEIVDVGKEPGAHWEQQGSISGHLIERARCGLTVVRLKGGDPFVFGRGFEELDACRQAGIPCVVIPGVSSAVAGPASVGIPVTLREVARSFAVVTASTAHDGAVPDLDFGALAKIDTIVVLMGHQQLSDVCSSLREAGMNAETPAACIERATTPAQRVVTGTLTTIADAVDIHGVRPPMVTIFGAVVASAETGNERTSSCSAGLVGRRVLSTRPASRFAAISRLVYAAGATPLSCPLTRIVYPEDTVSFDDAMQQVPRYDWIVFTSSHGVRGFWRGLQRSGLDTRAITFCRVGAVGPGTARALRRIGVVPDTVSDGRGAVSLASAIMDASSRPPGRVLFPCGNRTRDVLVDALISAGAVVDAPIVYETVATEPSRSALASLRAGVDAVLFYSPSAVERFVELRLDPGGAAIACIGETTAAAARYHGLSVALCCEEPTNEAMVAGLTRYFAGVEVAV